MPLLRRPESPAAPPHNHSAQLRAGVLLRAGALTLAALAPLLAPHPARSQALANGVLEGTITPPSGTPAASPAASTILARSLETGLEYPALARRDGSFILPSLPAGEYTLHIEDTASPSQQSTPFSIVPGETLEIVLPLAGARTARQATPGLPTGSSPELDRNGGEPDENGDGLESVRGLEPTQGKASLDGAGVTQVYGAVPAGSGNDPTADPDDDSDSADRTVGPSHGLGRGRHAGLAYGYAQGSVQEFRLGTRSYGAQVGSAAGVHAAVTRSGGPKLHGAALFNLRSSALDAKNPLALATSYLDGVVSSAIVKPHDLRQSGALALGGPIPGAPRLFFFYAFDVKRRDFPAISSPVDPDFYHLTSIQQALLANRGVSRAAINTQLNFLSSLTGPVPRRSDQTIHFGRLDLRLRPALLAALEYNRARFNAPAGLLDAPTVARGRASLGNATGSVDQVLLRLASRLPARTQLELHAAFNRDQQFELPQAPLPQEPAISPGGLAPEVTIGPNGILFGTPASLSHRAYPDETVLEAGATATLPLGHHLLAAGGTVAHANDSIATSPNPAGTFRYDSGATRGRAGGLVDFITDATFNVNTYPNGGCPSISAADHLFCFRSFTQSFGEELVRFNTTAWSAFIEDTWHPHPGLALHAGLRYEYTLLPLPQHPNSALDTLFGAQASTSIFPEDRNNFGPRLSTSFEPFGRGHGVLRAGYGVFFGHLPGATIRAALAETGLPTSTTRVRITPSTITECPQVPGQGFGYPCSFPAEPGGVVAQTTSAIAFDRHFRLPVVQQASVEFERDLTRTTALSLGFVLNSDRQLPGSTDLNIAPSTSLALVQLQGGNGAVGVRDGETFVVPRYTARLSRSFGPITEIVSHANASYNGLVLRLATQPVHDLRVQALYTWSKAIDFGQGSSATPRTNGQFDPFADGYDKGLSSLNYPQALHATATWRPRLEGSGTLARVAGGWSLAAISTARSGRPYSYDLSGGPSLPGGHESLNGSGGALYLPTIGRNTLRLPPTIKTDLRLGRSFRVGRSLRGEAAAEIFNVFNHQSISSVNQRAFLVGAEVNGITPIVFQNAAAIAQEGLNITPFATPNGSGSNTSRERQVQLTLRLAF